jgi:radical SAM protein with 4Fe4S-binding SPASM domain
MMGDFVLELTQKCNFHCNFCKAHEYRNNADMDYDKAIIILEEASKIALNGHRMNSVTIGGNGELLLYSRAADIVKEAKKRFNYVDIVTNGYLLTENTITRLLEADIDRIEISITGVIPEIYSKFQGSGIPFEQCTKNLERVIDNVTLLVKKRQQLQKKTAIVVRFIKTNENKYHLKDYITFWRDRGIDAVLVTNYFNYYKKKGFIRRCVFAPRTVMVYANGRVRPCNCGYDTSDIGNINDASLTSILSSENYYTERKNRMSNRKDLLPKTCLQCEHRRNLPLLEAIKYRWQWIFFKNPIKNFIYKFYGFAIIFLYYLFRIKFFYDLYVFALRLQSIRTRKKIETIQEKL